MRKIAKIEEFRNSRVILLVHRPGNHAFPGFSHRPLHRRQ
jgi:hypothetical protein